MLCRYVARVSQIGGCGPLDDALAVCESSAGYAPRNPAESVLYNVVAGDLENFLAGNAGAIAWFRGSSSASCGSFSSAAFWRMGF